MNRKIKKVAILGSGIMGSRIACHFANIGVQVVLLDIVPRELSDKEKAAGLTMESPHVRNRIVNEALQSTLKSNPSPIYNKKFATKITTGNFDDDFEKVSDVDWIMEVVIENLDIKKQIFEKVDKLRKKGTIISSNTSSIPIHQMIEGRSEDFVKHFLGTHFFNPPRYLRLLEIIPTEHTDKGLVDFLMDYGSRQLGKVTVECKDTTAFIANRIGVFGIMAIFHLMKEVGLTVEEVDALTGPVLGRPKSATFRTCDLVGIDTLVKVADIVRENRPNDEARELFKIPDFVNTMVEKKWLGDKTGQGFYKKVKNEEGKSEILALDLDTLEYKPKTRPKFATLDAAKPIENLHDRVRALNKGKDKAGEFLRKLSYRVFSYVSHRIPEIADELYKVDDALNAGFGWELGPFETWDVLGIEKVVPEMEKEGYSIAPWVKDMLSKNVKSFYKVHNGKRQYYDINKGEYLDIPGKEHFILLDNFRPNKPVWQNSGVTLHDIGDGVLNLEFHTKMNSIGSEVLEGINKSIEIAENGYKGLVIANEGQNFSAGANIGMIFMLAVEQEYDELDFAIRYFQNTMMRVRYSSVPVVVAPHGLTLGGGCEMSMHADKVVASAETYIGLVEVGVGVIPAGGGTKEFVLRTSDKFYNGDVQLPRLQESFINIATAKVATSAHEAYDLGILREGLDMVVVNQDNRIAEAKKAVIQLSEEGYTQPVQRDDILVLGRTALGSLTAGVYSFKLGQYATAHDSLIAQKLAYAMCGGDLSEPTKVTEQYLLDLERQAFLSLLGEKKTLERMQSILQTGKPLRN
ncbi:MAG: 3-hydroxyacyl-CoA dehydrogenase/enoyl-CoA hydratase family protein [Chitinophagaceae bacterium]|nr:MAG: 3-hydroxyacyl-CoA dehydrogenase/enoyl-CoA hydratase family protein [Chitinophagaceae bacterium]